jgi:hypothetical protein
MLVPLLLLCPDGATPTEAISYEIYQMQSDVHQITETADVLLRCICKSSQEHESHGAGKI